MKETQLNGYSLDIKEENIEKIQSLFPEVFKEGKIDFDLLKQILGEYVEDSKERYNFTWNGKGQALRLSQTPSAGTLRPCKEESKDWDTTQNLYIEGDNLEVLKLLQKSYHNKVKMIYIDPPYNTGKDFVYPDDFRDTIDNYKRLTGQVDDEGIRLSTNAETSGRYHTDWLNMMYPRLRLARNLLTDDGVIFISIDDNEVDNLKKICNEVFGEGNFVAILPTVMNLKGNNDEFGFAGTHEYTIVYVKDRNLIDDLYGIPLDNDDLKEYNLEDSKGLYKKGATLMRTGEAGAREKRPKGFYPIYVDKLLSRMSLNKVAENDIEVYPIARDGKAMSWRRSPETLIETFDEFIITGTANNIAFYKKQRLEEAKKIGKKPKTLFYKPQYSSGNGTMAIKEFFDERVFDNPKPVELIKDFISIGSRNSDIILDFFSGSATTAHAIMQLNAEDGGKRKFIMVQLPEKTDEKSEAYKAGYINICDIGKERIRRAGEKVKEEMQKKYTAYQQRQQTLFDDDDAPINPDDLDIGFKVLKLDTSNIRKWQPDFDHLDESLLDFMHHYVPDRTDFDMLYEIMIKYGLDLGRTVEEHEFAGKKYYSIGLGELYICIEDDISIELAKDILAKIKGSNSECTRVVFKDNGFSSDSIKTNVNELFKTANIEEFVTI